MVGGMLSSTLLTLVVIPVIYAQVKRFAIPATHRHHLSAQYDPAD